MRDDKSSPLSAERVEDDLRAVVRRERVRARVVLLREGLRECRDQVLVGGVLRRVGGGVGVVHLVRRLVTRVLDALAVADAVRAEVRNVEDAL